MNVFLFDIDGTLIHSAGAGRAAIGTAMIREFDIKHAGDIDLGGRTDRGIARELFEYHDIELNDSNWRRFVSAYLQALPIRLQEMRGQVLPGVRALLQTLAESPATHLGLLTGNVRQGAQIKLQHFDLWSHFSFGGFGDNSPLRDDVAREAALDARQTLDREIEDAQFCVVGDTVLDVRCAKAIGAKSVAVCTGSGEKDQLAAESPDMLLENLECEDWWLEIFD